MLLPNKLRGLLLGLLLTATPALAQPTTTPMSPAQWREDLQMALDSFLLKDRTFAPAAAAAFRARVTGLRDSAHLLSSPQIMVRLARAVALSGNAHTRLYLVRNRSAVRRYPVRLWWFDDGLYVVKTSPEHAALLGARVLKLAGQEPEAAHRTVAPLYAGNASWQRYMTPYSLTSPEILQGLGLVGADGLLTLQVQDRQGRTKQAQLAPLPFQPGNFVTEAWWNLAPRRSEPGGPWQSVLAQDSARLPVYLQLANKAYTRRYLPAEQAMYIQYNRAGSDPNQEPFAEFAQATLAEITAQRPRRVVVDLRFNTGGNLHVAQKFLEELSTLTRQQGAQLVALSGRATFSAGIYPLTQLRAGGATIVGQPVGDHLDFWAEGGNMVLPNSRLSMHYADRLHSYSARPHNVPVALVYTDISAPDITPAVPVRFTFKDYVAGRDPWLEAALRVGSRPASAKR